MNDGDIKCHKYQQIRINKDNLKLVYGSMWLKEKPLKVIIHGFQSTGYIPEGVNSIATGIITKTKTIKRNN